MKVFDDIDYLLSKKQDIESFEVGREYFVKSNN